MLVRNCFVSILEKRPDFTYHRIRKITGEMLGIPARRVAQHVAEFEENGFMTSSAARSRRKKDIFEKLETHEIALIHKVVRLHKMVLY